MGDGQGSLENLGVNPGFWKGRRVLVTGHTGFKGAWLTCWLELMGADVCGFALAPEGTPNLWALLDRNTGKSHIADINDQAAIARVLEMERPEIVMHLAAQSLVRRSYAAPIETFATNVVGTVTLLHLASQAESVRGVVVVTSDKCYENYETGQAYREDDRMGGRDPYSASKGCAELATAAMRASYFQPYAAAGSRARVATARAGNVIGGGDWSEDRLVPDIVRGCLSPAAMVALRSPRSVRPWQHVLEPLGGYLMLAEQLFVEVAGADAAWNFGPDESEARPVLDVAQAIVAALGQGRIEAPEREADLHEAKLLHIDSAKARELGWSPVFNFEETIRMTADWYRRWSLGEDPASLCAEQIESYMTQCGAAK